MINALILKLAKSSLLGNSMEGNPPHRFPAKSNGGFTLIELLVVLIIVGILSAIALPSFLNQTGKARQAEAKTYLGSVIRGQQAFFTEQGKFADSFEALGVSFPEDTANYDYSTEILKEGKGAIAIAIPKGNATYKGYLGVAGLINADTNPAVATKICESKRTGESATLSSEDVAIGQTEIVCTNGAVALE